MPSDVPASPIDLATIARRIPLLARCGYRLVAHGEGRARGVFPVTAELGGGTGHLNGTELYGLLDCTAWCAIASLLGASEAAVTHDAHFSMLGVAKVGSEVVITAEVVKRGRTTGFVRVEATADGKTFALATVTKTIVPLEVRMRHAGGAAENG